MAGSPESQSPPAQETPAAATAATSSEKEGTGEEQKQVKTSEEGSGKASPDSTKAAGNEENQPMEQSEAG